MLEGRPRTTRSTSWSSPPGSSRARSCWLRAWFRYLRQTGLLLSAWSPSSMRCAARRTWRRGADRPVRRAHDPARRRGARRSGRRGRAARSTKALADGRCDRRRPHPAADPRRRRRDRCAPTPSRRRATKRSPSSSIPRSVPGLPAPVPWREIWVYSPARRGHPSARRPDRPRRPALVRPARRFPHRDPRPDEGAGGQECGDRADRRQGRLLSQATAARPSNRDAWLAEGTESYRIFIRALLSVTDNLVKDKVVHPDRRRHPRRRRSLFRRRRRQGHRDLLRRRQCDRDRARLLARRRLRQRRLQRLRPQGDGDHRQGRLGLGPAPLPRAGRRRAEASRSASPASATCRATCSATACCCRRRSSWSPPSTTATSSSIPIPIRRRAGRSASGCSTCRARPGPITIASLISKGGGVFPRSQKSIPLEHGGRARCSASTAEEIEPGGADQRDPARAPADLLWFGGIGTYIKATSESQSEVGDPGQRRDPRQRRGAARQGDRRGRQPRHHPGRRASSSPSRRADQHRLHRQSAPASIARTMRSTSRSRSTAR